MAVNILTQEDLQQFKTEFFTQLKTLLAEMPKTSQKQWLRSYEIKKMIGISSGTLQTMRNNKTIAYTKVGSLTFYAYEDVVKLMERNKRGGNR